MILVFSDQVTNSDCTMAVHRGMFYDPLQWTLKYSLLKQTIIPYDW